MKLKHALHLLALLAFSANAWAVSVAQLPLFTTSVVEPRVMLLLSRDHELSKKAYNDYSDLNNDGVLDITYNDSIDYYGYFDQKKCYSYASSRFEPAAAATGANSHHCSGQWSGNFLNWASMTRMDVLRKTFFGGYRSTDQNAAAGGETVLERHFLPDDVHAFVKVFNPGSAATLNLYIPSTVVGSNTAISLCNVSDSSSSTLTGNMAYPLPIPLIKVAAGSWPQWDSSNGSQCALGSGTQPAALLGGGAYTARVKVCDTTGGVEANCKRYTEPTTGVATSKPIGLLQEYGDVNAQRPTQFGLMTGSYAANKSGGVLRKNIGPLANNAAINVNTTAVCGNNNTKDEIDVCTGQFINQSNTDTGIINTINRLRIAGFKYSTDKHEYSCNSPGLTSFSNGECVDWGNPLGEMYLETLRYFANAGATTAFDVSDANILSSIPKVTWTDPLPSTEWCAISSIIALSTGHNSFDTDQLASFTPSGGSAINAATLTQTVGDSSHENINGGTYLIGDNGSTGNNQCTAKTISNLATAKGLCPEGPSTQGGYSVAGLAYAPKTIDLRPAYATNRATRWGGNVPDWALRQPINTYAVQLAETLPSFSITVGSGTVTLLPACQANSTGSAAAWTPTSTGWRNCSMTNLIVDANVAMADVGSDATAKTNTCSGNGTSAQCFTIPWEDSSWGNDYDMDGIQRLGYCVGSACSSFKMLCPTTASATATVGPWTKNANEIVVATCAVQADAGHALTFGYTIAGTALNDGAAFPILRPGGNNFNVGALLPATVTAPNAVTYLQGSSSAKLLENPLWYAAKYGGFTESTPASGTPNPNLQSEWDKVDNTTGLPATTGACVPGDCIPDNYFDVRNPAQLSARLSKVLDQATLPESSASAVATNSTRLDTQTVVYQAKFRSKDWSGQLLAYKLNENGTVATPAAWDSDTTLTPSSTRNIKTHNGSASVNFNTWANLSTAQQACLNKASTCPGSSYSGAGDGLGSSRLSWLNGQAVTGMRPRTKVLGDIINSDPTFVYRQNYGYHLVAYNLEAAATGDAIKTAYANYLDSTTDALSKKRAAHLPLIFVGANDGMMHAFRADTGNADSGKEVFAYVPKSFFPNLAELTDSTYSHRYFADGTAGVGDAYIDTGDGLGLRWRTILVSSVGAGGKAVFALDITDVSNIKVLWEKDSTSTGWEELGTLVSTPVISRLISTGNTPRWSVVLGNGYNSASGKAMLMIVDLATGTVQQTVDTGVGGDNGLGSPAIYNANFNAYVGDTDPVDPTAYSGDAIYAADIKGNVWKFINTSGVWASAYGASPLFQATDGASPSPNPQPITSPLEIGAPPSGQTGVMIQFGTGRYFATGDSATVSQQSLYGIWDNGSRTVRSSLQAQTLTQVAASGVNYRVASTNSVNYPTQRGWYINLPTSGERVVSTPLLRHGRVIFTTLIPSADVCLFGGNSWLVEVNATTGANLGYSVFDLDNNNLFNTSDYVPSGGSQVPVSGVQYTTGIVKTPAVVSAGEIEYKITSSTSSAIDVKKEKGVPGFPRSSWREIR